MADFVSFNEFLDYTADARVGHHIETLRAGLARAAAHEAALERAAGKGAARGARAAAVSAAAGDDTAEAEFRRMKDYVLKYYKGVKAEHTFLDVAGNFVDCIPFEQQATVRAAKAAGLKVPKAPPPHRPAEVRRPKNGRTGFGPDTSPVISPVRRGTVDLFGNSRDCPEGTVPLRRVTIARLAWYGTFAHFFSKTPRALKPSAGRAAKRSAAHRPAKRAGARARRVAALPPATGPDGAGHFHAICQTDAGTYYGCSSTMNLWAPNPAPGVFSLCQLWLWGALQSNGNPATIESGWMVDSPGGLPHLFVFFNPDGYANFPNGRSGYVNGQNQLGFILYPGSSFYPWMPLSADQMSTTGGKQYEIQMGWDREADGAWWLHAGLDTFERVGCFPAGLYDGSTGLSDSTGLVQFGGEVASNGTGYGLMGSGLRPYADPRVSYGSVAFQREVQVIKSVGGPRYDAGLSTPKQDNNNYTVSTGSSDQWGSFFFYGGPQYP